MPGGRRFGNFRHTPQGILHGANDAYRAEFQARASPACAGRARWSASIPIGR
jgi:hypothetical protein